MSGYRTRDVTSGWSWRAFIGGSNPWTADRIIGGHATTEAEAEEKAKEALARYE